MFDVLCACEHNKTWNPNNCLIYRYTIILNYKQMIAHYGHTHIDFIVMYLHTYWLTQLKSNIHYYHWCNNIHETSNSLIHKNNEVKKMKPAPSHESGNKMKLWSMHDGNNEWKRCSFFLLFMNRYNFDLFTWLPNIRQQWKCVLICFRSRCTFIH